MPNIITKNLTIQDIANYYKNNCKPVSEHKIGLEYERITVNKNSKKTDLPNIIKLIQDFAQYLGWNVLYDGNIVIGAISGKTSISMEPGGQLEISIEPKKEIYEIKNDLSKYSDLLDILAKKYNIEFLNLGINPYQTYKDIEILPKTRYLYMFEYFKNKGKLAPAMMKETAGMQINIDYENEEDAVLKFNFLNKIMPFLTGLFANSSIRAGKLTSCKSFRALIWKYTDSERSGDFLFKINSFEDYIDKILNVPMIFYENKARKIPLKKYFTFDDFMEKGIDNNFPNINDYILHSSLAFPDIRLKNSIEIRNHDTNSPDCALALCAFYKGLFRNMEAIKELDLKYSPLNEKILAKLGYLSAKYGTHYEICDFVPNYTIKKILEELFKISFNNLNIEDRSFLSIMKDKIDTI